MVGRFDIAEERPDRLTFMVFYRGLHCPIWRTQLTELETKLPEFGKRGVRVVALSSDNVDRAVRTKQEWKLPQLRLGYGLELATARSWGLYISAPHGKTPAGVEEPALFSEPGLFLMGVVLPCIALKRVLRISLVAMLGVCAGLLALNHSGSWSAGWQWAIGIATAAAIMVESGFTPAALALLAGVVGAQAGRGAAMGIYSMLLGVGAIGGSLLAAVLGEWLAIDGLIFGTLAMALIALVLLNRLHPEEAHHAGR